MKQNKTDWRKQVVIVCVLCTLLFVAAQTIGFFGIREEWMRNDGWSHRPFLDFLIHQHYFRDVCINFVVLAAFLIAYPILALLVVWVLNRYTHVIDETGVTVKPLFGRKMHIKWNEAAYVGPVSQTLRTENMPGGKKSSRTMLACSPKLPYKKYPDDVGYTLPKGTVILPYTDTCAEALSRYCSAYSEFFWECPPEKEARKASSYTAIFEYASDGINITFPDVPSAITCAANVEEGMLMAEEALRLTLHGMKPEELPLATPPEKIPLRENETAVPIHAEMEIRDGRLFDDGVTVFFERKE